MSSKQHRVPAQLPGSIRNGQTSSTSEEALPMSRAEMDRRGWDELDVLFVTGDAYVDHPSFGVALLGRWLVSKGFRVGIVAQPNWDSPADIECMGRPRLYAGVTAGTLDSLLAHYTSFRKKRSNDEYTPGGKAGARPNRATLVYSSLVRHAFPGLPLVIGGVEASLRRASHYDFWTDKMRRSILLDSKADLCVYGMGERAVLDITQRLHAMPADEIRTKETLRGIPGTIFAMPARDDLYAVPYGPPSEDELVVLPSHQAILDDPKQLMKATLDMEQQSHRGIHWAVQESGDRQVVMMPPAAGLSTEEMDELYDLPYTRSQHPSYTEPVPAAKMIQFSVTAHRGCAGGCTFCSITLHQGRDIRSRSEESIKQEVTAMTQHPDWEGSLSDVGGPTANMWGARCADDPHACKRPDCLTPTRCKYFECDESKLSSLLKAVKEIEGVKHLRISSGIRYDMTDDNGEYVKALVREYVGGQLKIAPEHMNDNVLKLMRKPKFEMFQKFLDSFGRESEAANKEQYVIPYLISAFPGCTDDDMRDLSAWLRERNWKPRQVQCFLPTPGAVATAMFYAGVDTKGKPISVARTDKERLRQHRILMPDHGAPPSKNRDRKKRKPSRTGSKTR